MKFNKISRFILTSLLASSLLACSNPEPKPIVDDKVWTTYPTMKVIKEVRRNEEFIDNGSTAKIQMMRDEYESTQVILTSGKRCSYEFTKAELKDSSTGKTIPVENMQIYVQKYLKIPANVHGAGESVFFFYAGESIPDMLLPIEKAYEFKENVIEANSNQGFSIEVDSNGLDAGVYKGNFTLTYGDNVVNVPIEVTIWDFKLDHKSKFQSCWLIYSLYMLTGEYDASKEMMDTYSEFLSKYKANPYVIQERPMNNPKDFVKDVKNLWKIRNYNTITIPFDFPLSYYADTADGDVAASYIVELAKASTEENFYLGSAIFYPSTYDEADVIESKRVATPHFFEKGGEYQKTLQKAINMLESEGYFHKHSQDWNTKVKNTILQIPAIFTNTTYVNDWVKNYPATFCPQVNLLKNMEYQEIYKDMANRNAYGNLWDYTCCIPNYPYPSNHIDDDCLSMRSLGWMEKAYGVNGYLFFMANMYGEEDCNSFYETPYDNPWRNDHGQNGGAIGDGFIMYPGRYYESSTPFPSMRLLTYRDGLEDYEMLEVLEEKYLSLCDKYGVNDFNFTNVVSDLYNNLFNNAITNTDHHLVFEAREELANRILNFENDDNLLKIVKDNELEIYTTSSTLKVDGEFVVSTTVSNGYKYSIALSDQPKNIELITETGNKYHHQSNGFENITNLLAGGTNVSVTEQSSFEIYDGYVNAKLKSIRKDTEIETEMFNPSITIKGESLANAKRIFFKYTNTNEDIDLTFKIKASKNNGANKQIGTHFASSLTSKNVSIEVKYLNVDLTNLNTITISLNNFMDDNKTLYPDRTITIFDIFVEY